MNRYTIGDSCLSWVIGDSIDLATTTTVLAVYRKLKETPALHSMGVHDIVPSYTSIAVHYNPIITDIHQLELIVHKTFQSVKENGNIAAGTGDSRQMVVIPVIYNGDDLDRVASCHQLTRNEVIELHTRPVYTVAMVGFKPHFPYLIGLDDRLETPRLETPRTHVPAGAVAIGGAQTGIYPEPSPGGWNILGLTDPGLLQSIEPGDRIRFKEAFSL